MKELTKEERKEMIKGSNTGLAESFMFQGGKGGKGGKKKKKSKEPVKVKKVKKPQKKAPSKKFAEEVKAAHAQKK